MQPNQRLNIHDWLKVFDAVCTVTASNRVSWSSQLEVRYGTAYSTDAGLKKLYWLGSAGFLR